MSRATRLVHVFTVPDSLIFISDQVALAKAEGCDVTLVTSPDPRLHEFGRKHGVRTVGVDMPRRLSPLGDWAALQRLRQLFLSLRPDIVHAHTPKGGLLGTLAAQSAGVPVRLYQMRGLLFSTMRGAMRTLTVTTERLSCAAATHVICQSPSLRAAALAEGVVSEAKSEVVLRGSNGVDSAGRFNPQRLAAQREGLRAQWRLPPDAVVIAFVGRLVRDKGVPELVQAFTALAARNPAVHLLVAGPFEDRDAIDAGTRKALETHPRIRCLGFVKQTEQVYAAADLVTLPSHREGFPNVPLEASAMGLPVVSTLVPGCTDAVVDGVTGALVPVNDAAALEQALARYADSEALRASHGAAGRALVEQEFRRDRIATAMLAVYRRELARAGGAI